MGSLKLFYFNGVGFEDEAYGNIYTTIVDIEKESTFTEAIKYCHNNNYDMDIPIDEKEMSCGDIYFHVINQDNSIDIKIEGYVCAFNEYDAKDYLNAISILYSYFYGMNLEDD